MPNSPSPNRSTVMVCGYFDGLHPGHVRFLQKAADLGDVIVGVGCDERLKAVKKTFPLFNERERLAMIEACRYVLRAFLLPKVEGRSGIVWEEALVREMPDAFLVNDDIDPDWLEQQRKLCSRRGIRFLVSNRDTPAASRATSSTKLREASYPYRVCLTTGMDQVALSSVASGACIGFSIEPTQMFDERSGMATSTRMRLMQAFGARGLPEHLSPQEAARLAFSVDNPPQHAIAPCESFPFGSFASRYITGAVDPITMLIPGVSLCEYSGNAWPRISTIEDTATLDWLEQVVTLTPTRPRPSGEHFRLDVCSSKVASFAAATYDIWGAIGERSLERLMRATDAACGLFGQLCPSSLEYGMSEELERLRAQGLAVCVQGAGHGGYIACVAPSPGDRIQIKLQRPRGKTQDVSGS